MQCLLTSCSCVVMTIRCLLLHLRALIIIRALQAPRSLAKGLLRKLRAHKESLILGEFFAEVLEVPEVVRKAVIQYGPLGVVCIFDQHMHWAEGTVLGTQLCKRLRDQDFIGLVIIRSANDRYFVLC